MTHEEHPLAVACRILASKLDDLVAEALNNRVPDKAQIIEARKLLPSWCPNSLTK